MNANERQAAIAQIEKMFVNLTFEIDKVEDKISNALDAKDPDAQRTLDKLGKALDHVYEALDQLADTNETETTNAVA